MAKHNKKKGAAPPPPASSPAAAAKSAQKIPEGLPPDERADVEATLVALEPLRARGITAHRLAAAAGSHPDDMIAFLEGRISLTWALRERLRDQAPGILDGLDPMRR